MRPLVAITLLLGCRYGAAVSDERVAVLAHRLDSPADADAAAHELAAIGSNRALDALVTPAVARLMDGRNFGRGADWLDRARPRVWQALARWYPSFQNWRDRADLIWFAEFKHDRAAEPLVEAGMRDPDGDVAASAIGAVGLLGLHVDVERMISFLHDPVTAKREAAATVLGGARDARAIPELIHVLVAPEPSANAQHDYDNAAPDPGLHQRAADAIDEITGEHFGGDVPRIRAWLHKHQGH